MQNASESGSNFNLITFFTLNVETGRFYGSFRQTMKDLTDKTIPILTELKTLVSLRDKKIEEQQANVEQYKQLADEATEEKEKERKERIETIFMYESRIKGKFIVITNPANWIKPHFKQSNIFHLERTLSGKKTHSCESTRPLFV